MPSGAPSETDRFIRGTFVERMLISSGLSVRTPPGEQAELVRAFDGVRNGMRDDDLS